ncbi:MAG: PDZ domain-containing protein [Gemmatimonadetes bacterium]|nr:PDZ domain-containing protein [Gemmatimonadota bacterium]
MFDPLKTKTRLLLYTLVAFVLGIGGASVMGWTSLTAMPSIAQAPQVTEEQVRPALDLSDAFVNVSEAVTPAVVRIEAEKTVTAASLPQGGSPFDDPQLRRFFNFPDPQGQGQPQDQGQPQVQTAGGSGFLVSEDGYILTNDHVVTEARTIRVYLSDHREYTAHLVGTDPTTDVAVIKIEGQGFPTLSLGSSSNVRVGEWVLAIGNPGFGGSGSQLEYTVTAGIVSAKGRPLNLIGSELRSQGWEEQAGHAIEDFIQTDAVINPGNSGGPMVNMRGQAVGINSAIASETGYYQGYGFAIPIELAGRVMQDLIAYGEVRRARLGIAMEAVSPVDAELYKLPTPAGALIMSVADGTPAAEAGLRQEDVVVAVDGQPVGYPAQLQSAIAQKSPGDRVTIAYYRDGQRREVSVRLDQAELTPQATVAAAEPSASADLLGIEIVTLDPALAQELEYTSPGGVVIRVVNPASPAARRGGLNGMRLLQINRQPVNKVEDAKRLLAGLGRGDIVTFQVQGPDGSSRVVNLQVPR